MTVIQEGLPTNGDHVNVKDLHPEFKARLKMLFNLWNGDPIQIRSGARSYAHQKALYDAYVARGRTHPVVANPDVGYGSKHQVRPVSYVHGNLEPMQAAYAVDLMWTTGYPTPEEQKRLAKVAATVGLLANVASEWWHFIAAYDWTIPVEADPVTREEYDELVAEVRRIDRVNRESRAKQAKHIHGLQTRVTELETVLDLSNSVDQSARLYALELWQQAIRDA